MLDFFFTVYTLSFVLETGSSSWFYLDLKNVAELCVYLNITPEMTWVAPV